MTLSNTFRKCDAAGQNPRSLSSTTLRSLPIYICSEPIVESVETQGGAQAGLRHWRDERWPTPLPIAALVERCHFVATRSVLRYNVPFQKKRLGQGGGYFVS